MNIKEVSELDFGLELITWENWGVSPLEVITFVKVTNNDLVTYRPSIPQYDPSCVDPVSYVSGFESGYATKKELLSFVGYCWDIASSNR